MKLLRKGLFLLLAFIISASTMSVMANSEQSLQNRIRIELNGQEITFEGQQPVKVNGATLVPTQNIFELMGFDVIWYEEWQMIRLEENGQIFSNDGRWRRLSITMNVGRVNASVVWFCYRMTHERMTLNVAPQLINGEPMLPLRDVLDIIGASISWNAEQRIIGITYDILPTGERPIILEEPAFFTNDELVEMVTYAVSERVTTPSTTHPERRMTQQELEAWIAEYQKFGGISGFELKVIRLINEIRAEYGISPHEHRLLQPNDYIDEGYVCTQVDGSLIKPHYVSEHFKRLLAKHDMPPIRFHDLRHSSAGYLKYLGFDLKDIQAWLRHGDIATTANIYLNLDLGAKRAIAENPNQRFANFG